MFVWHAHRHALICIWPFWALGNCCNYYEGGCMQARQGCLGTWRGEPMMSMRRAAPTIA